MIFAIFALAVGLASGFVLHDNADQLKAKHDAQTSVCVYKMVGETNGFCKDKQE